MIPLDPAELPKHGRVVFSVMHKPDHLLASAQFVKVADHDGRLLWAHVKSCVLFDVETLRCVSSSKLWLEAVS